MAMRNRRPRVRRAPKKPVRKVKALSKIQKNQVKAIIHGAAESKRTAWYNSFNDGTVTSRANGLLAQWGYAVQNNLISANNTDALRLIPTVLEGTDDFNRIGSRIEVQSLKVQGVIRVNLARIGELTPTDIRVVLYVLSHKQFKDYNTLYSQNNFAQLLDTQEGGTINFKGVPLNEGMRVADQYYTVHVKKVITLRYAGWFVTAGDGPVSVANSHNYYATYNLDLTKYLPKTLKYPETNSGLTPEFQNAPTNAAPFLAMGFVNQQGASNFGDPSNAWLQQSYVSNLTFKDL